MLRFKETETWERCREVACEVLSMNRFKETETWVHLSVVSEHDCCLEICFERDLHLVEILPRNRVRIWHATADEALVVYSQCSDQTYSVEMRVFHNLYSGYSSKPSR